MVLFDDHFITTQDGIHPASFEAFQRGEVDVIPLSNIYSFGPDYYKKFDFDYLLHTSNDLSLVYLLLTAKGKQENNEIKKAWSDEIHAFLNQHKDRLLPMRKLTRQFFLQDGYGGLNQTYLEKFNNEPSKVKVHRPIVIGVHSGILELYQKIFRGSSSVEIVLDDEKNQDKIDAKANSIDASFDEDLNYLEFLGKAGFFPDSIQSKSSWLSAFSKEKSDSARDEMTQDLHYKMVRSDIVIIPLFTKPYFSIARNGWYMDYAKNYVTDPFWLIKRKAK